MFGSFEARGKGVCSIEPNVEAALAANIKTEVLKRIQDRIDPAVFRTNAIVCHEVYINEIEEYVSSKRMYLDINSQIFDPKIEYIDAPLFPGPYTKTIIDLRSSPVKKIPQSFASDRVIISLPNESIKGEKKEKGYTAIEFSESAETKYAHYAEESKEYSQTNGISCYKGTLSTAVSGEVDTVTITDKKDLSGLSCKSDSSILSTNETFVVRRKQKRQADFRYKKTNTLQGSETGKLTSEDNQIKTLIDVKEADFCAIK